jgi:hypothetical protein
MRPLARSPEQPLPLNTAVTLGEGRGAEGRRQLLGWPRPEEGHRGPAPPGQRGGIEPLVSNQFQCPRAPDGRETVRGFTEDRGKILRQHAPLLPRPRHEPR